jgi:hypothetical protein
MGEWNCNAIVLYLGTRWRRVISFTRPGSFTPGNKASGAPWRADKRQSRFGRCGVESRLLPLSGMETHPPNC